MDKRRPTQAAAKGGKGLELGAQLCFALYSAALGMNKVYRGALRELDVTYPQYLVLLVLWERDEVNVSEICARLYLETATLTPLLKRLEARGLIRRRRSAVDERQVIVTLTKEGRALRTVAERIPVCVGAAIGLSAAEVAGLRRTLASLRDDLMRHA
jgi:DNA-binding MarR family transcriptional regulator